MRELGWAISVDRSKDESLSERQTRENHQYSHTGFGEEFFFANKKFGGREKNLIIILLLNV